MLAPALVACMTLASSLNGLPEKLLPAIHTIEGGKPGSIATNKNGTQDFGVMQINSSWLPTLADGLGKSQGEIRSALINDGCFNIQIAGFIVKHNLDTARGDVWKGVGLYSSHTPTLNLIYQAKVAIAALKLQLGQVSERSK
jgi:hypothetical protein